MAKSQPLIGALRGTIGDTVHYGSRRVRARGVYPECSCPEYRWAIKYLTKQYAPSYPQYLSECVVKPGCGPPYTGLMNWAKYVVLASTLPSNGLYGQPLSQRMFPRNEYLAGHTHVDTYGYMGLTSRWSGAGYQLLWKPTFFVGHLKLKRLYYLLLPVGMASGHMGHPSYYPPWAGVRRTDWPLPMGSGYYSWLDVRVSQGHWIGSRPMVIYCATATRAIDNVDVIIGGGWCSSPG